ncbi:potassium-transporting ATPase subunit F [Asticcacaulis sp.]
MTVLYVAAGLITVAIAGYLIIALIRPELFP